MADREQSHTSKGAEKLQRDGGARTSGSKGEERAHGVREVGSVGRDEPDQSKERNTEIAVETGRKGGERRDDKR
jgi:hypothetical protein